MENKKHKYICPTCNESFFSRNSKLKIGKCRLCWRKNKVTPQLRHDRWLRSKFGITLEYYNKLFKTQNECCAICKRPQNIFKRRFAVDHCHTTNKVRGLLCMDCNVAVGHFKDNFYLCLSAAEYLKRYNEL
jgi:hypothetical protein